MRRAAIVGVILCASSSAQAEPRRLPIVFHVAQQPGGDGGPAVPVADDAFIEAQLAAANAIFAPYELSFAHARTRALTGHTHMESRADRHALGTYVEPGVINCFIVASLRDVDEPSRMRSGVHWHSHEVPGAHYVILSVISEHGVLAHELGHFLGNPRHSDTPGNLMSYQRTGVLPFLEPQQLQRMRRRLRRYLRSGELEAVPIPSLADDRVDLPAASAQN